MEFTEVLITSFVLGAIVAFLLPIIVTAVTGEE